MVFHAIVLQPSSAAAGHVLWQTSSYIGGIRILHLNTLHVEIQSMLGSPHG